MKIIGYYTTDAIPVRTFVDETVKLTSLSDLDCDFVIDVTNIDLLIDPRKFLHKSNIVAAYYGDYLDANGNLCIHGMFPSPRSYYPGTFYNLSIVSGIRTNDIFSEMVKSHIISYIPEPIVKISL